MSTWVASGSADDESWIEWIKPDRRVGVIFDAKGESSWFLVLRGGQYSASGYVYGNIVSCKASL